MIYILLPVYNKGISIYNLLRLYKLFFEKYKISYYNIIIINDCSQDESEKYILKAKNEFNLKITYILHEKNRGLAGALKTAFNELKKFNVESGDVIVTMDGDNTHNPFTIKPMLEKIDEGADIVIASRYLEQSRIYGLERFRIFLSNGAKYLYKIIWNINGVNDYTCNFRAYKGYMLIEAINYYGDSFITEKGFTVTTEILKKVSKFSQIITEVPMLLKYNNKMEESNMKMLKTIKETIKILWKLRK